jgi:uncharacterized protein YqcC (DUF446 family)
MSSNDAMNQLIRTSRSAPTFDASASPETINAAIREAAGYPPMEPQPRSRQSATSTPTSGTDPRTHTRQLLAVATAQLRDSEPLAGIASVREWDQWVYSRAVAPLLDQDGRLPGEHGYSPSEAASIIGADFDMDTAMAARRQRWQALARHF